MRFIARRRLAAVIAPAVVLVVGAASLSLAGCIIVVKSTGSRDSREASEWSDFDGRAEQHFDAKEAPAAKLAVDNRFLDVEITAGPNGEVAIHADVVVQANGGDLGAQGVLEHLKVSVAREGDTLVVRQGKADDEWSAKGGYNGKGKILITVPSGIATTVYTASGDVRLSGEFGAIEPAITTASGDVTLAGGVKSLTVTTASGDAKIEAARQLDAFTWSTASGTLVATGGAAKLAARSASGDINVAGLAGPAQVSTASGGVRLAFASFPSSAAIGVRTASGDVAIELPSGAAPSGSISTASGSIASDTPISVAKRSGTLTGNGAKIEIETASGDVRITKR